MVKTLHSIDEIATSISLANANRVTLTRESAAPTLTNDRLIAGLDPKSAVIQALADPLEFPPLAAGIVPGDRVAIALDEEVPCAGEIVCGVVEALARAGIEPDAIAVVAANAEICRICRDALAGGFSTPPRVEVHDPDDERNLCMVGLDRRHQPLLVNRTIFDADIVLPIAVARVEGNGPLGCLYPRFSNAESIRRHRTPENLASVGTGAEYSHEAEEAGWLIGALMVVQVVPGIGETVARVVAGEPQAVALRCEELCRELWSRHSPRQVDLVIATISGGSSSQTWANVARALTAAEPLLAEAGAVAICTNLDAPPGESLGRLIGSTDLEKTERKIGHDQAEDSWTAWQLARALQRGPVYLLSQLAAETIEDMGLAPIADIAELARLAGRHESFILIEDAQHAAITIDDEIAEATEPNR